MTAHELADRHRREELERLATEAGVEHADELPNKLAVAEAILAGPTTSTASDTDGAGDLAAARARIADLEAEVADLTHALTGQTPDAQTEPAAPSGPVWVKAADGRLWHVDRDSETYAELLRRGGSVASEAEALD